MSVRNIVSQNLLEGIRLLPTVPAPGVSLTSLEFDPLPPGTALNFSTITIINSRNRGMSLLRGTSPITGLNGISLINPGARETFEIHMMNMRSMEIGDFRIDIGAGTANIIRLPLFTYEAGVNYEARITQNNPIAITETGRIRAAHNFSLLNE